MIICYFREDGRFVCITPPAAPCDHTKQEVGTMFPTQQWSSRITLRRKRKVLKTKSAWVQVPGTALTEGLNVWSRVYGLEIVLPSRRRSQQDVNRCESPGQVLLPTSPCSSSDSPDTGQHGAAGPDPLHGHKSQTRTALFRVTAGL